jgi:hypothetical protein
MAFNEDDAAFTCTPLWNCWRPSLHNILQPSTHHSPILSYAPFLTLYSRTLRQDLDRPTCTSLSTQTAPNSQTVLPHISSAPTRPECFCIPTLPTHPPYQTPSHAPSQAQSRPPATTQYSRVAFPVQKRVPPVSLTVLIRTYTHSRMHARHLGSIAFLFLFLFLFV